ncbi:MAG: hypothetical protein WDZ73_01110, partial [Candidatus Paceibacterota bacterium]
MILLLSIDGDAHTDSVISAIEKNHGKFVRLDTDKFAEMEVSFDFHGGRFTFPDGQEFTTGEIGCVWGRRRFTPSKLQEVDLSYRKFAECQWASFMSNIWTLFDGKNWLNHPRAIELAKQKIFQLRVAQRVGFSVPRTIFTNTLKSVKELMKVPSQAGVIYKPVGQGVLEKESGTVVYTSVVQEGDMGESEEDSLRVAPGI